MTIDVKFVVLVNAFEAIVLMLVGITVLLHAVINLFCVVSINALEESLESYVGLFGLTLIISRFLQP